MFVTVGQVRLVKFCGPLAPRNSPPKLSTSWMVSKKQLANWLSESKRLQYSKKQLGKMWHFLEVTLSRLPLLSDDPEPTKEPTLTTVVEENGGGEGKQDYGSWGKKGKPVGKLERSLRDLSWPRDRRKHVTCPSPQWSCDRKWYRKFLGKPGSRGRTGSRDTDARRSEFWFQKASEARDDVIALLRLLIGCTRWWRHRLYAVNRIVGRWRHHDGPIMIFELLIGDDVIPG